MSKYSLEEAKQKVAEKYEYESWNLLIRRYRTSQRESGVGHFWEEAAELLAKNWANEAVMDDRDKIIEANPTDIFLNGLGDLVSKINMIKLNKIGKPYPEIEQ